MMMRSGIVRRNADAPWSRQEGIAMKKLLLMILAAGLFAAMTGPAAQAARTHEQILQEAQAVVERVCGSMVPFMEQPGNVQKFAVLDEDEVNAFADDNARVAFYMGILNFFQSEDELAAVCGHELAHLSREHIKKSVKTGILATIVSEVVGGTAGNIAGNLIYSKKSRSFERESDRNGLLYAWHAGYDPKAGIALWEGMGRMGGSMAIEKYLSSHPVDSERIENFKVSMYRDCKDGTMVRYCNEILADPELQRIYQEFESRK